LLVFCQFFLFFLDLLQFSLSFCAICILRSDFAYIGYLSILHKKRGLTIQNLEFFGALSNKKNNIYLLKLKEKIKGEA